jgi:hypothetical protein
VLAPCIPHSLAPTAASLLNSLSQFIAPKNIGHSLTDCQPHTVLLIPCSVQLYGKTSCLGLQIFKVSTAA